MRDEKKRIEEAGGRIVLVGNGTPRFARAFREDLGWDGLLLTDPALRAYRAAGLRRGRVEILSPRLLANTARALGEGYRQEGVQGDPWQLGGALVIQRGGRVTYRQVSREAGDHAGPDDVVAALAPEAEVLAADGRPSPATRALARAASALLDPTVVFSFDRSGFERHAVEFDPEELETELGDARCVVTGANSGIGFETARALADLGAEVVLVCRNAERADAAVERIRTETGNPRVRAVLADLSDLASVRELARELGDAPLDVLVHNAGVLPNERVESADGREITWATHVLGPHLLTRLLRERLSEAKGRVVWVSSGGMYARRLELEDPEWLERDYDGVLAYAETKRAQVVLARRWARELTADGVMVASMHPGWADTPAVRESLPRFHELLGGRLRSPAQGADTVVWLAAAEPARGLSGRFVFDRAPTREYWLPGTRESRADRKALWSLCEEQTR